MASALENEIPNIIEARSFKQLRVLMFKNNIRLQMTIQYFDFQKTGSRWMCFYNEPFHKSSEITELKAQ